MLINLSPKRDGQAMVELAIVLPVLLLLIMAIADFGRIFHSYLIISNASREGARVALINYDVDQIRDRVTETASSLSDTVETDITNSDQQVTVRVIYRVNLVAPLISHILPNPFTIRASTTTYI